MLPNSPVRSSGRKQDSAETSEKLRTIIERTHSMSSMIRASQAALLLAVGCSGAGAVLAQEAAPAPKPAIVERARDVAMSPAETRKTIEDLAQKLQDIYVFPDVAKRYAAMLRANAAAGVYDGFASGRAKRR
jgi:hypothetical protein